MTDRDQRPERSAPKLAGDPFRLNLEQQKKRAKELLKALKAGDPDARARFVAHHPRPDRQGGRTDGLDRLSDAQLVIARELGVPSWPALKAHIAEMDDNRSAMGRGAPPDSDTSTLHIRCGSDMKDALKAAGFVGDFLEYSNPFCQGPVLYGGDFLARRAAFLSYAAGTEMGRTEEQFLEGLESEERALAAAAGRYERVVLWFEHDTYDQLILARCLAQFAGFGAPRVLELVSVDRFPGAMRFIGIGQLPPEALRLLWPSRQVVDKTKLDLGRRIWDALRLPEPLALFEMIGPGLAPLPHMSGALHRHLQELPSVFNGAALTKQLTLEILTGGPMPMGRIFRDLTLEKEPMPWLGDLMFFFILEEMLRAEVPPIEVDPASADEAWPQRVTSLTEAGRAVLAGEQDYLACNPPERWVGGVQIVPGNRNWRWDGDMDRPVRM